MNEIQIERIMFFDAEICFCVRAYGMAVHYHIGHDWSTTDRHACGVEFHRIPPDGTPPDQVKCRFLGVPCCHDGSTLMAYERFNQLFYDCNYFGDFEPLWRRLEGVLLQQLKEAEEGEQ